MRISGLKRSKTFVKIRKDEWDELNRKVDELEQQSKRIYHELTWMIKSEVEGLFNNKVRTHIIKISKDEIVAETRNIVMNNLFKEEE